MIAPLCGNTYRKTPLIAGNTNTINHGISQSAAKLES
jgi:hypothetical protein